MANFDYPRAFGPGGNYWHRQPATAAITQALLRQALPTLADPRECPACHQPMEPYGSHWRCECGHLEER